MRMFDWAFFKSSGLFTVATRAWIDRTLLNMVITAHTLKCVQQGVGEHCLFRHYKALGAVKYSASATDTLFPNWVMHTWQTARTHDRQQRSRCGTSARWSRWDRRGRAPRRVDLSATVSWRASTVPTAHSTCHKCGQCHVSHSSTWQLSHSHLRANEERSDVAEQLRGQVLLVLNLVQLHRFFVQFARTCWRVILQQPVALSVTIWHVSQCTIGPYLAALASTCPARSPSPCKWSESDYAPVTWLVTYSFFQWIDAAVKQLESVTRSQHRALVSLTSAITPLLPRPSHSSLLLRSS